MVYSLRSYLVTVALAFAVLQMQPSAATSLLDDPVTECNSTDLNNKNFPGRGAEIEDDGTCTVTEPKHSAQLNMSSNPTAPVTYKGLLANSSMAPIEPVYTKVGKPIMPVETPPDSDPDAYVKNPVPTRMPTTIRKLDTTLNSDTVQPETNSDGPFSKLEAYYGTKMEVKLKNLPTTAVYSPSPWGGSDWAVHKDSINFVWNKGQPSATEKYATAFGLNVKGFMNGVSARNGIDAYQKRSKCTSNTDCASLKDSSVCAIRPNKKAGYCIPKWFGICDG